MQVPPLGRGQRGRTSTKFYHDAHNNEETLKRIREEDKRHAEQQDRQDELAQRQLEVALEMQHQEYTRKVEQKVAQSKEEKRRVEILEDRILLGNTARSSYRIGDINVSGLTMLQRIETLEKVCNFLDGPLDLSTRLTKLETWVVDGVWDESVDHLLCSLVDFSSAAKTNCLIRNFMSPRLHCAGGLSASEQSRIVSICPTISYYAQRGSTASCCREVWRSRTSAVCLLGRVNWVCLRV